MSDQGDLGKKAASNYAMILGVVGIVGFQIIGRQFFERPPGGGIDFTRVMWAGIVGGAFSGIGYVIGKAVGGHRK